MNFSRQGEHSISGSRRLRRGMKLFFACALPAAMLAIAGTPLSQVTVEVAPLHKAAAHANSTLALTGKLPTAPLNENKKQDSQKAPRLLKVLADQWESASRVQVEFAATARSIELPIFDFKHAPPLALEDLRLYFSLEPPNPPARGPPLA